MTHRSSTFAAATLALFASGAAAQQQAKPTSPERHVRGDLVAVSGNVATVKSREGETIKLELADDVRISAASKADLASIDQNGFIGTTAVPQADGTLRALEVHVFPESMRGAGEGHRPWDLKPGSSMTNATISGVTGSAPTSTMTNANVANVSRGAGAMKLVLKYPQGEKTVVVPAGTPIVKLEPADRSLLVPGAHIFAAGSSKSDGTLIAQRMVVGAGGVVPPM